jgi:2-keto-4-pentenoate hydratase
MAGDLQDPMDVGEVASRIGRIGLAAELVDVSGRLDDVESVIAHNIFHTAAVHSASAIDFDPRKIAATRITATRDDRTIWWDIPVAAFLPDIRAVVSFVGASLALDGERLRAGERIMSGVLTPLPIWVRPGNQVRIEWSGIDAVTLNFAPKDNA